MNKIVAYIRLFHVVPAVEALSVDISYLADSAAKGDIDQGAVTRLVNITKALLGDLVTSADAVLQHRCPRSLRFALIALRVEVAAVLDVLWFMHQLRKRVF